MSLHIFFTPSSPSGAHFKLIERTKDDMGLFSSRVEAGNYLNYHEVWHAACVTVWIGHPGVFCFFQNIIEGTPAINFQTNY